MNFVLLCAYNEEAVIRPTLKALAQTLSTIDRPFEVVLVDDGSDDGTLSEARAAAAESAGTLCLHTLSHAQNAGLGAALRTGIDWVLARAESKDLLITLDADNTHPPRLIPALLAKVDEGADVAVASRYQTGAIIEGVPHERIALSFIARWLLRVLFPMPGIHDYTCCFRAYRIQTLRRASRAFGGNLCEARGFEAVMDLLLRLRAVGAVGAEIPIELEYSGRVGNSKMKVFRNIRNTLLLVARRFVEGLGVDSPRQVRARLASGTGRNS